MAIKVREKKGKNGDVTPYFEYNFGGERWYEFYAILKYKANPTTDNDKIVAKENKELLNRILREKELQLALGEYDIKPKCNNKQNFFEYLDNYIESYPNTGDIKAYKAMRRQLQLFVSKQTLPTFEIDEAFLKKFVKYLEKNLNYETPMTYFKKLKKVLKMATKQGLFRVNPADDVTTRKYLPREKDILSTDEIELLYHSKCPNHQVKNAFLFAVYTGLRFVDVNKLTWKQVESSTIKIFQSKTKKPLDIPIHENVLKFIGERKCQEEKIFDLPSHTACLKSIRKWTKNAGIEKHITFHCARHSLGSILDANGVNVSVISRILGHSGLKDTMRYVRTAEAVKVNALNTLPNLKN